MVVGAATLLGAAFGGVRASRRFDARLAGYETQLRCLEPRSVDLDTLPSVVRRWLDLAVPDGAPPARLARLEQRFEMNQKPGGAWLPGTAIHLASLTAPGFAWSASASFAPMVSARVYDALVDGEGFLEARAWGALPVVRASGPATTKGELQRWLAELPWTPLAVRQVPGLRWRDAGADTVRVEAGVGTVTVAVSLRFDPDNGLPVEATAEDRPRGTGQATSETRWRGAFTEPRDFRGYLLPARAEVSWFLDGIWVPYWRGEVLDATVLGSAVDSR
jgi:hypothetical protein